MAKSLEFGRSVLVMDADDSKLEAALKADEQLVTQSVNKMQGNLNKLEVSMTGTGGAAGVATTGVTALSAAAAATGSVTLMATSQIANMGIALRVMGNEALSASAQLAALSSASVAFLATPVGLAVVTIAAAFASLALAIRSTNKEMEEQLKLSQELADREIAALEQRIKFEGRLAAIMDKIAVAEDEMSQSRARGRELRRASPDLRHAQVLELVAAEEKLTDTLEANAQAARDLAQADKDAAVVQAREDKLIALRDELAILSSSLTKYDLIADAEERGLQIQIDQTREMQEQAKLAEDRARAERERFEGKGPKTAAEAETLVRQSLQLAEANQRSGALVRDAVDKLKLLGIDSKMLEKVAQSLGASAKPVTRFGQGAIELSAFAATGRGGGAVAGPDPVQAARIAKEDKRTKDLEEIRKWMRPLTEAITKWNPGAN